MNTTALLGRLYSFLEHFGSRGMDFTLYTRIYIAAGSLFLVYALSYLPGFEFSINFGGAVFGAVLGVYAMNRMSDLEEDEQNIGISDRRKAKWAFLLGIVSAVLGLFLAWRSGIYVLILVGGFIALLTTYSFQFLPGTFRYRRLKEIPYVKNLIVGTALGMLWISGGLIDSFAKTRLILGLFGFLSGRVFIGSVIPDVRDIEGDQDAGVKTIPVLHGVDATKKFLLVINTVVLGLYLWMLNSGVLPRGAEFAGLVNIAAFPVLLRTNRENAEVMTLLTEINTLITFSMLLIGGLLL